MTDESQTIAPQNTVAPKIDGHNIRRLREGKGLTQLYVATVVGVTTDTISRWENRRYPSIKPENAKKLAEALDVTLNEIIDQTAPANEAAEALPGPDAIAPSLSLNNRRWGIGLALFLAAFIGAVLLAWWPQSHQPLRVTATRILPPHAPIGLPFPVAITLTPATAEAIPLIISETMAQECAAMDGVPPFNAANNETRTFKWISKPEGQTILFYMAMIKPHSPTRPQVPFAGEITLHGDTGVMNPIGGDVNVTVAPYHWADRNRDYMIDDEEILTVYDTFGAATGLRLDASLIEDIWSGHGYRWDAIRRQLVVIP